MKQALHIVLTAAFWIFGIAHVLITSNASEKISPAQAMKVAEQKTGGKAKMAVVELEKGEWVYGVFIEKDREVSEVNVHPSTGKTGNPEAIAPHHEANEFRDVLTKSAK